MTDPAPDPGSPPPRMPSRLRRWFLAGLLVWVPLGITLLCVRLVFELFDALLPEGIRPDVPGLGLVLTVALLLVTGALATNFLGARVIELIEALLQRIPLVRTIHGGMKTLADTLLSGKSRSLRQPVLIEYPRKGLWAVGFIAGDPAQELLDRIGRPMLSCYIPTAPSPTAGYLVLVPEDEVVRLSMTVEEALSMIISLGVVTPDAPRPPDNVAVPPPD